MKLRNTIKDRLHKLTNYIPEFEFTSGIVLLVIVSCLLFFATICFSISPHYLSLGSSVVLNGHVHKLFTYSFYHKDVGQLLLSAAALVAFCSGLEKGVGTVRFLYLALLLSSCTGLLHVLLELLLFPPPARSSASGLIHVSLSLLGLVTIGSRMKKAYLMGVSVPTASFPWLILLLVTVFVPGTVFLCNALAILTGQIYGMGWFKVLDMSEFRASILEKKMPFRLFKNMVGVHFVPASAEERRKTLHIECKPPPGSYPVQAYAPAPAAGTTPAAQSLSNMVDGWPHSAYMQHSYTPPSPFQGYSHGYGHNHGHGPCHGHSHEHAAVNQASSAWGHMAPYTHAMAPSGSPLPPAVPLSFPGTPSGPRPVCSVAAHGAPLPLLS